jgi:hypothetical protein
MGSSVGLALMGSLFLSAFGGSEPEGLMDFRLNLDPQRLEALVAPLVVALRRVFWVGAIAAAMGVLLALAIPAGKARDLGLPAAAPAES